MMNVDLGHNNGHIVNKITRRVDRDVTTAVSEIDWSKNAEVLLKDNIAGQNLTYRWPRRR